MRKKTVDFFTEKVKSLIINNINKDEYNIYVFLGINDYIDIENFRDSILDYDTFCINGNEDVFTKKWRMNIGRMIINDERDYCIMSYPQYCYCESNISDDYKDGVIFICDNLRSLFPIPQNQYIDTKTDEACIEKRPENLPIYQAEQTIVKDKCFYSIKMPSALDYKFLNLFEDKKPLTSYTKNELLPIIDLQNDSYDLDMFINECLLDGNFDKKVCIKRYNKHPLSEKFNEKLELINSLLNVENGCLFELSETDINNEYHTREDTGRLLKKYWGEKASFRDFEVYENPDVGKKIIKVSQGLIVDTIISEYDNARSDHDVRDLFLTAPTGSGKSLLFQLPAFYIASKGDVTIIISPLIALMSDQVESIKLNRKFKNVEFINSTINLIDRERIIKNCKDGNVDILYMAPELLLSYDISFFIGDRKLGLLVVDEAHLITTWGRDFRIDYWHVGGHIKKIRKLSGYKFPVVAVTATAIYGGDNDMVFDTIDSLQLKQPHLFIGKVKRDDVTFVINNYDSFSKNYDKNKEEQTVGFIEQMIKRKIKTIVYVPFTRHIDRLIKLLDDKGLKGDVCAYQGQMQKDAKDVSMAKFKNNDVCVMICTKAFGMGIDIPDIQVVYHHAPSGVLPDYIQEIGRVARDESINGFAALNYAEKDQKYSKMLHGMSSLRMWQLQAVLKKLYDIFVMNGKKRNMLVSTDDFDYIFPRSDADELSHNVQTALMMIEKDYLAKVRFNVLVARPKKLFVNAYARTDGRGLAYIKKNYEDAYRIISEKNNSFLMELELDKIWKKSFSDKSFPTVKFMFYGGFLFQGQSIDLSPEQKFIFDIKKDFKNCNDVLNVICDALICIFSKLEGSVFSDTMLNELLSKAIPNDSRCEKLTRFILSSYSDIESKDSEAFLQARRQSAKGFDKEYRVINKNYNMKFTTQKRIFNEMFSSGDNHVVRFAYVGSKKAKDYVRLGCILDIFDVGTYECRGGDNPMIFIRINDPYKVERDSKNAKYENLILKKTTMKHNISSEIFDHFFLNSFENSERWSYVEDFFLGMDNNELFENYPSTQRVHTDVAQYIANHISNIKRNRIKNNDEYSGLEFPPEDGTSYSKDRLLTIDGITKKIVKWVSDEPMEFHKTIIKHELRIDGDMYKILMTKLRANSYEYYRDFMGLDLSISFPGYDMYVKAKIPYKDKPIEFYKWWKSNQNLIHLSNSELILLFFRVEECGGRLLKEHKQMLLKK